MPLILYESQTWFAEPFTAIQLESHTVRNDVIIATYSYGNMIDGVFVPTSKEPDTTIVEMSSITDILAPQVTGTLPALTKVGIYQALQRRLGVVGVIS